MVSITAAGTASGLDIESIIETLTQAERVPEESRINTREIEIQANISAYGSLKGALEDFRKSLSGLSSINALASRSASSSDTETFTASATSQAAIGSTKVQVTQLASNHKLISKADFADPDTAVGAGTLTLNLGTSSFDVEIISGVNNTLTGIRDAINDDEDNPGISASILTISDGLGGTVSKLVLTSNQSGEDNYITVSTTGDSDLDDTDNSGLSSFNFTDEMTGNMDEVNEALNATIILDDIYNLESSTNVFQDAIEGVTITAVAADPGNNKTLTVNQDTSTIKIKLSEFVAAFNALNSTLDFLTDYDPETQEAGLLTGDFSARTIENQLRRSLGTVVEGISSTFTTLASIGITTQRDGALRLDDSILSKALNSNLDDVTQLLGGDAGIMNELDDKLGDFLTTGGLISNRNKTFLQQLKDLDEQREKLDRRIVSFEERIRRQYTSMDILVGQLQNTGDFVTQQLSLIKAGGSGKSK